MAYNSDNGKLSPKADSVQQITEDSKKQSQLESQEGCVHRKKTSQAIPQAYWVGRSKMKRSRRSNLD